MSRTDIAESALYAVSHCPQTGETSPMKKTLSIAALLAATALPFAAHAEVSANLSASYANFTNGGGDLWNVDGALSDDFGGHWGGELTGGYHNDGGDSGGN